jgi:Tol biopolymer transport system component
VYRARDTKVRRDVALKVLPDSLGHDPERLARFEREARMLGALNHPHIAQIYGVEDSTGVPALVMELVEGPTLADRIAHGPIPIEDALPIAKQIAEGLEAAHELGIVHRDLKPANIKLRPDGLVKVLDFGLAKALEPAPATAPILSVSPTITSPAMTHLGVILGTAAYMAPEQAKGQPADRRSDIWAFGCVLYEMLTGTCAFPGEDISDTLANVLKANPNWALLPATTPTSIRTLLRRCLAKDRQQRLQAIGEARIVMEHPAPDETAGDLAPSASRVGWSVAAVASVLALGLAFVAWKHFHEEPPPVVRFSFLPPEKGTFAPGVPAIAVSPDGRRVAFQARVEGKLGLWLRDLDNPVPRLLAPISGMACIPFWAPDSRRLGFFDGTRLKKIDVTGGPAVAIAEVPGADPGSGSWNQDDVIIFGRIGRPLFQVRAGGSAVPMTQRDGETDWAPWFLPDGRHFLYLAVTGDPEKAGVDIGDLDSTMHKRVLAVGSTAIYVNPGYVLYLRDRTLMAQRFDAGKLEATGEAVPVAEQIDLAKATGVALGHFSASQNGMLAYTAGNDETTTQVTWFDRSGTKLGTIATLASREEAALSPDGTTVVFERQDPQTGLLDLWTRDLARGSDARLTTTGNNLRPVWAADNVHVFFLSNRNGVYGVYEKAIDGTGQEQLREAARKFPMDASRDGRYLITRTRPANGSGAIWVMPLFGDRKPSPYLATEFNDDRPRISPDGRWLAYQSDRSRRNEVYVASFPQPTQTSKVSTNGGQWPFWSRDGRKLYYYSPDNKIMEVEATSASPSHYDVPKALFDANLIGNVWPDVTDDGRFLLGVRVEQDGSSPMTAVLNWPELLTKK